MISIKTAVSCAVALLIVFASVAAAADLKKVEKRQLFPNVADATPAPVTPAPATLSPMTTAPATPAPGPKYECGNSTHFERLPNCGLTNKCEQSLCTCFGLPATCDVEQGFGPNVALSTFSTCFGVALQCIISAGLELYVPMSFETDPNPCVAWAVPIARDYADYVANSSVASRSANKLVMSCNAAACSVAKNTLQLQGSTPIDFSSVCMNLNTSVVPTYVVGSPTQFTCPDGIKAANLATCACSANAAISGVGAIFRRQITSDNKFDASQPLAATAYSTYRVPTGNCSDFDFSPFVTYRWELSNTSGGVAAAGGSSFKYDGGLLQPGSNYTLSLIATDMFDKDTSKNFTFTAIAPKPIVVIKQGSQLRVSTMKTTVINVSVIDSFPGANPTYAWSCASGTCPPLTTNTSTTLTLISGYTAGTFTITFTYKSEFTANITITAVASDIPSVQIIVATDTLAKAPIAFFRGKLAGFASSVAFSGTIGAYTWTLNGQASTSTAKFLNLDTSSGLLYTAAADANINNFTVNTLTLKVADSANTVYGESTLSFVVIDKFAAISVAVVNNVGGGATAIALTDTVQFTVASTIVPVFGASVEYAFAFQDNGRFVPLAVIPDTSSPLIFRALAPYPKGAGLTTFAVRARFSGAEISNATATLTLTAPSNVAALANQQLASLASVSGAGNSVKAAGQLMGLLQGANNASLAASIAAQVVDNLVKNIADASALSPDEQGALMASIAIAVTSGSDSTSKKAMSDKLAALLSTAVSGSNFDVAANGDAALNALSSMDLTSSANVLADLARAVGNNPNQPVGVPVTMKANNVEIVAVRQSMASLGGQSLSGTGSSMTMPADLASSLSSVSGDAIVAAGSTSYGTTNPYSTNVTASTVVSFELSSGGKTIPVSGLSTPMEVRLSTSSANVNCYYWNTVTKKWANDGVQTVAGVCKTSHLTAFSLFSTPTTGSASTAVMSLAVAMLAVLLHVVMA